MGGGGRGGRKREIKNEKTFFLTFYVFRSCFRTLAGILVSDPPLQ